MSDIVPGSEEDFIRKIQEGLLNDVPEENSSETKDEKIHSDKTAGKDEENKEEIQKTEQEKYISDGKIDFLNEFLKYFLLPFLLITIFIILSVFVKNIFIIIGFGLLSTIIIGFFIKFVLNFTVNLKFENVENVLTQVSMGNLQFDIKNNQKLASDLGRLAPSIDKVIKEISDVITKMELSSLDIIGNSDALSFFASSMAKNTESHEDSIVKIDTSAKKLNDSMQNIRRNVESAYKNSKISITEAETSSSEILSLIDEMNKINDLSDKILNTMNFISEIADETNLLALNAAIQAAHAGEEGRGFAVVATEIRSLSESSSRATKTIYSTIEQTLDSIVRGVALSEQAKKALSKIITLIKSTEDLMGDINGDINMQTETTNKLKESVENIQELTRNINSDTQNMKSAISNLAGQAQVLKNIVKGFEVNSSSIVSSSIIGVENHSVSTG